MVATVIVAALGFASTVLGAWLTARSHRQGDREGRILDAKVRIYGECSDSLYEYARATYNRAKAKRLSQTRIRMGSSRKRIVVTPERGRR